MVGLLPLTMVFECSLRDEAIPSCLVLPTIVVDRWKKFVRKNEGINSDKIDQLPKRKEKLMVSFFFFFFPGVRSD